MNQSVQIPQPDLPASILPTWSSPSLLKPSRTPHLWPALELTTRLPSYTLRPSLLSDNTACFIMKGALPPYPSQVSHTLLLYSEILDKYLTWLKGQTQNEERVKRDFSIHTHTQPSYITTSSVQNVLLTTGSFDKQSQVSYPLDQEGAVPLRPEVPAFCRKIQMSLSWYIIPWCSWLSKLFQVHGHLILCSRNLEVGEGNGTPLQYSCLENPMDGRAW